MLKQKEIEEKILAALGGDGPDIAALVQCCRDVAKTMILSPGKCRCGAEDSCICGYSDRKEFIKEQKERYHLIFNDALPVETKKNYLPVV